LCDPPSLRAKLLSSLRTQGPIATVGIVETKPSTRPTRQYLPRRMGPPMCNCTSELALRLAGTTEKEIVAIQFMTPRSRDANSARGLLKFPPSKTEGAGKTGCLLHPRSRVQMRRKKRTRAYRYRRSIPAFPAQWLYGLLRALPGERLFCHRRRARMNLRSLTPAPRPHDFAVRVTRARLAHALRPPHLTARS